MDGDTDVMVLDTEDPLAVAAVGAIHAGDVAALMQLLAQPPGLATARLGDYDGPDCAGMSRTLLHVVTDWPGHYPNGAATVAALVAAGADVNARFTGPHTETPLHWAASSDGPSGVPATVASSNARSFFSTAVPTGTGYRAERTARRWTRQPATAPPLWSTGCAAKVP
jgi:hypothetical protein